MFRKFVDSKFDELDKDKDGKLSLKELHPAVADIGAALGLPAQGTNPESDHIYYETLNTALGNLPKDRSGKISKDYLRVALDVVSPSAGLPPVGAIEEMHKTISEAFKMVNAEVIKEEEFKKILTEILGGIMLQLEGSPIAVSSNSVVHEPLGSSSTLLQTSSSETA